MPVVNYNGLFGLVESGAGLLGLALVVNMIATQKIIPIPYTEKFIDSRINFVKKSINKKIKHALIIGSSESCNHYAIIIREPV